jgi:hypothetical protein
LSIEHVPLLKRRIPPVRFERQGGHWRDHAPDGAV